MDFDPSFHPMEKWTPDHPKEQIIGNPNYGVLRRAHVIARNEALNVHQEFFMFNVFISII